MVMLLNLESSLIFIYNFLFRAVKITSASARCTYDKRGGCSWNYVQHTTPLSRTTSPSL